MSVRMVVSDMDGTLLNKRAEISEGNLAAIRRLEQNGIEFVIASGRDYHGVYSLLEEYDLNCEAILGNGSQYVDREGKVLMSCYMDKSVVKAVTEIFGDRGIPYMIFATDGFYTGQEPSFVRGRFIERSCKRFGRSREDFDQGGRYKYMPCNQLQKIEDFDFFLKQDMEIIKVEAFAMKTEEIRGAREILKEIPGISYLSSFDDNVEVTVRGAQKGYILEKVIGLKGLSREQVMVIGDGMNDLTLFECFPVSYAPANAQDRIRELAMEVVADCEEDGFAQAVDRMLEGGETVRS